MNKEISDLVIFLTGSIAALTAGCYSTLYAVNNHIGPALLGTIDYSVRKSPKVQKLYSDFQSPCKGFNFIDTLKYYHKNFKLDL